MGDEREPATITVPIVLPLHQHTRAWQVVAATLGIMLVAAIVIAGYLWNVNGKWQAQVSALTDTGYSLGDRIAEHQAEVAQLESTNSLLSDQLANAKERVLTLSNEKAQWRDDTAYAQQQVEQLAGQLTTAISVANQMNRCIEGEQQLVLYLRADALDYPAEEIAAYEQSVNQLCASALQAKLNLEQELTE